MMLYSVLSVLWLICGFIAVIAMLALLGGKPKRLGPPTLKKIHRCFGVLFSIGALLFILLMFFKYEENGPLLLSPLAIHAYLGALLFPLLLVKHLVVRFFKKYYGALPYLGVTIFLFAFGAVCLTGGHNLFLWVTGPGITVKSGEEECSVVVSLGRDLLQRKCGRCHDLRTTYVYRRSEEEWSNTVKRMSAKDTGLIGPDQEAAIVGFLTAALGPVE